MNCVLRENQPKIRLKDHDVYKEDVKVQNNERKTKTKTNKQTN